MLVNIIQTFDEGGKRWFAGENPDVASDIAARWIADLKATADRTPPQVAPGGLTVVQVAALEAILTANGGIGTPLIVAKTNQTYTHTSVGTASPDNVLHTVLSFVIPGGSLGPNGSLVWETEWDMTSSGPTKAMQFTIGSEAISPQVAPTPNNTNYNWRAEWHSTSQVGAVGAQIARGGTTKQLHSNTGLTIATAIDMSIDQTVLVQCRWNGTGGYAAAETISLRSIRAWVEFGA